MSDTATTTIPSFEPVLKALKDVTGQFQFGTAAREYVERSASRAQESLTRYHHNATSFSRSLEVSAFHGIETYANISRNAAELAYRNARAQLGLVQSLAGVKSFEEGVRVYTDYLKNANETNLAALRGAADYVKDRVTEALTGDENLLRAQKIEIAFIVDDNLIGNKKAIKLLLHDLVAYQRANAYPFDFFTEASLDLAEEGSGRILPQ